MAEATECADHLVGDEENAVLVADATDLLPVTLGGHQGAAGVLHGFHDDHRDGLGTLRQDSSFEIVGTVERAGRCIRT